MSATRSSQIFHRCQEPERLIEGDLTCGISPIGLAVSDNEVEIEYRRIGQAGSFTCRAVTQKLETQNQKEDQISIRTTPDNAESEVFSDSRRIFHDFFLEKVILYGEVAIKSRYLEAKPLKFSPPKSLCGTVGSPWVSLATLFGFWETLIKFSESMILYGEKSFFRFFFFLAH